MGIAEHICQGFGSNCVLLQSEETFVSGYWEFHIQSWQLPSEKMLLNAISRAPLHDAIFLEASVDGGGPIRSEVRSSDSRKEFLNALEPYHDPNCKSSEIKITIRITKTLSYNWISIYSYAAFEKWITNLNSAEILSAFETISPAVIDLVPRLVKFYGDLPTHAVTSTQTPSDTLNFSRECFRSFRREFCHFEGNAHCFLPEDFYLKENTPSSHVNDVFDRIALIAVLSCLSDVSTLSENGAFSFKINGYRTVKGTIVKESVSRTLLDEFYKIYKWAYSEGCTLDKLGIARNLISLHWNGDASQPPDEGIFEAIQSSHIIYLKANVQRYIDLKNKLCGYLADFSLKTSKLSDSVEVKLEKNFVGFAGFFLSTLLIKSLTSKELAGLFPPQLTKLAIALVLASFVHLIVTYFFSSREKIRLKEEFNLLRTRFNDLLHKTDLDRVLNEDKGFKLILNHLNFKLRLFFSAWAAVLLICGWVVFSLSQGYSSSTTGSYLPNKVLPGFFSPPSNNFGSSTSLFFFSNHNPFILFPTPPSLDQVTNQNVAP